MSINWLIWSTGVVKSKDWLCQSADWYDQLVLLRARVDCVDQLTIWSTGVVKSKSWLCWSIDWYDQLVLFRGRVVCVNQLTVNPINTINEASSAQQLIYWLLTVLINKDWYVQCMFFRATVVLCCLTELRHFSGHFGRGQLSYPHCSWASLPGSLPVLSAFFRQ